jgi:hypothetical protein
MALVNRTTTRYDRARGNLDRHANYVVDVSIAGAACPPTSRSSSPRRTNLRHSRSPVWG